MQYKGEWYGCEVFLADRFYPFSQTGSNCETIKPVLGLGERTFYCETCGQKIDRDLNAAINLGNLYFSIASSAGRNACGEDGRQVSLIEAETKQQIADAYVCVFF